MKRILNFVLAAAIVLTLIPFASAVTLADTGVWDGAAAAGFEQGIGTADDPYIIINGGQLAYFAQCINSGVGNDLYYKLGADITLNAYSQATVNSRSNIWTPAGIVNESINNPFRGVFDGNHHTISGLYTEGDTYRGLFGISFGTVKNIRIENAVVTGYQFVGGVVGGNFGSVEGCSFGGELSGNSSVGGIAGMNADGGLIKECFNSAKINAISQGNNYGISAGGIVGSCSGEVKNCCNVGTVIADAASGGIVGSGYNSTAKVESCFNTGLVVSNRKYGAGGVVGIAENTEIKNCYYSNDFVASGIYNTADTAGVTTGLSPSQFANADNFVGFDFSAIWKTGASYPVLLIFDSVSEVIPPPAVVVPDESDIVSDSENSNSSGNSSESAPGVSDSQSGTESVSEDEDEDEDDSSSKRKSSQPDWMLIGIIAGGALLLIIILIIIILAVKKRKKKKAKLTPEQQAFIDKPEKVSDVPAAPISTNETVCRFCGSVIPEGFVFCGKCGKSVEEPIEQADTASNSAIVKEDIEKIPNSAEKEPTAEPVIEPVVKETAAEPEIEPVAETAAEPVIEPVVKETAAEEPIEEPISEPAVEPTFEPVAEVEPVVEPTFEPVAEVEPVIAPVTESGDKMLCANCGRALEEGYKFCMGCGTPVPVATPEESTPAPEAKRICANCGNEVRNGYKFCDKCGNKIN